MADETGTDQQGQQEAGVTDSRAAPKTSWGGLSLKLIVALVALLLAAGLGLYLYLDRASPVHADAPPRATDKAPTPTETTQISVPVDINSAALSAAVEQAIPRTLWTINQQQPRCIPPQKVKVFGKRINVTPAIKCTIIGTVTRGATRLRGEGQEIIVDVPIRAQISARDVGGILHGETATGAANFQARITMDVNSNWQPEGKVRLSYGWTNPPGIDFLGQRITFTEQADEKLRPVIAGLQATVQREFKKINIRNDAEAIWRQAFTSVLVNEKNPPVWMRLTPQKLVFGGYSVSGNRIRLNVGINGLTETFVGDRPADPKPTPLPALTHAKTGNSLNFFLPVLADYEQLEPVILRALTKRQARPFVVPGIGNVMASFDKVDAYGTNGNRIAVGLWLTVKPQDVSIDETRGMIWVTALPVNDPGSPEVRFQDLAVTGDTDRVGGDLLLQFGNSPGVSELLASSLTQNFTKDIEELQGKIRVAVDRKQEGDFAIRTSVDRFETGQIKAYGNGLYLPVRAFGKAEISYRPGK